MTVTASSNPDRILGMFEPFIQNGFVSLSDDFSEAKPIRILRDTGSAQSIMLENTLPFSDSTYSGAKVFLKGVDTIPGSYPSAPLHQVYLSSNHVNGPDTVGIQSSLYVNGIDFLLGNDLAGDKVIVNPLVTDTPCIYQLQDPVEIEVPNLDPPCVVTRASRKEENITDTSVWESTEEETSQEEISEEPEPQRPAKRATKQKPQGAGIDHEVESKKVSRRKSTEKGTYAENMGKRKKKQRKHLEENHQDEEKHQKEEEERRKRVDSTLAREKKERKDEDEEEVKFKNKPNAKKSQNPRKQQPQTTTRAERRQKRRKETAKDIADDVKESHEDSKEDEKKHWNSTVKSND